MCCTKNKVVKHSYGVVVQFLMKYPKFSFVLALLNFVVFLTWLFTRGVVARRPHMIYPIFHAESPVQDISNGSADVLLFLLQQSSISFVMYYAHWCSQSVQLVYDFHRASKKFKGQVSFIAINCWAGSCRNKDFPNSYPQLYLHHTKYEPVQYKGRRKFINLVNFVQESIRPLAYISNKITLEEFLDQGKPSLLGFFNGTNYQDVDYNEFFGAAFHAINRVDSLQFGVITSSAVAALVSLKKFGQVILTDPLGPRKIYPQELNYNWTSLTEWTDEKKIEYVKELDPDIMETNTFGALIKTQPSLILFVPMNNKDINAKILSTYHQVAMSYHNCSCSGPEPTSKPSDDFSDESPTSPPNRCHSKAHVTSCQSLPFRHNHGMQNSCDLCRECRETCRCAENSFPLQTFSVLRSFPLPRNSCRSLRRNSYQEKNALSVCCFDKEAPRLHGLLNVERVSGPVSKPMETGLNREEHLKILAEKLNKDLETSPSEDNLGVLDNLLGNLVKIFKTPATKKPKLADEFIESSASKSRSDLESDLPLPEFATCQHPGKLLVFAGASCYSNITVKFYVMESRKFWNYALAFGVRHETLPRVALVLVDSQNEAQYVLSEEIQLNNASITNFVMNFTKGQLRRRLRSAPVASQPCSMNSGCLIEVVSKTFDELVLDSAKDVFLMYYTPWCGFCKSVKHVIVSLVDHYKYSEHIRIARLNADTNDLPWEYTVDSYPTFIFFPSRRKDLSVKFPETEERTLENFVKFVETHKTEHVKSSRKYFASHVRIHSLQRNLDYLKRQNIDLRRRLNRQILEKSNAEKRRLVAERHLGALLDQKNKANFDYKSELQGLTQQNAELLRGILNVRDHLNKHRKIAQSTVEELRKRNWELHSTIVSLEKANLQFSKEPNDSSKIKT